MKRILITGKNSYIGTSFENWLDKSEDEYEITSLDMHGDAWKQHNFSHYDVVFHVAGIAHIKETKKNRHLYYEVNRDLAYETALKAKKDGVKQFIFLSTMSVYGMTTGVITRDTTEQPKNAYGKSKLEAEKLINSLQDDNFKVAILRPPMVYGPGCKGNYNTLSKFARTFPVFPDIKNKRSMIFIDNLSIFIKKLIDCYLEGIFFPQNKEYVSTSVLVKNISKINGKTINLTKFFNPLLYVFSRNKIISKVFGNLIYDVVDYTKTSTKFFDLEESLRITEIFDN